MNKGAWLLIAFVLTMTAAGCKRKKNAVRGDRPGTVAENQIGTFLDSALRATTSQYSWMRMKTTLDYAQEDRSYSANAMFKLQKDQLIWSSVSLIIELFRAQITPDSAVMMNRMAKQYTVIPVEDLQRTLAIQGLTLSSLQRLLQAEPPFGLQRGSKYSAGEGAYIVEYTSPTYKETMEIDAVNLRLKRYRHERNASEHITVHYSDFTTVGHMQLPKKVEFAVATPGQITVTLDIDEYLLLDTDEAPFSIPGTYKRAGSQ